MITVRPIMFNNNDVRVMTSKFSKKRKHSCRLKHNICLRSYFLFKYIKNRNPLPRAVCRRTKIRVKRETTNNNIIGPCIVLKLTEIM